jgi:yecA family protein
MRYETPYSTVDAVMTSYANVGAAEAHGLLLGMLCVDSEIGTEAWLREMLGDSFERLSADERRLLAAVYEETRSVLDDETSFAFDLFLPDDETPLPDRTDALGKWCQGFLYGLGQGRADLAWLKEYDELVADILEISKVDAGSVADDDEESYSELTEYLRVGVQLLYPGASPPRAPDEPTRVN